MPKALAAEDLRAMAAAALDNRYEPPRTPTSAAIQMPMHDLGRWANGVLNAHRKDRADVRS